MALRCGGHDLASLFRNAARGMYHLMGMVAKPDRDPIRETVCMTAPDVESLLVDWLSELAYRAETANQMFGHMDFKTLSATCLDVAMIGCRVPCCDHQIKAVTYHRLKITKTGAGLETVIVFDV
jgi:SHS2 domain-containing protein